MSGALWTEKRTAELRKLHALKLTPRQIAVVMGGTDRNAVIGKLHRMGLKTPVRVNLWTKERETQLRKLHSQRLTPRQIAAVMGGTDRNAVIGKLHRMGLKVPAQQKSKLVRPSPMRSAPSISPLLPALPDGSDIPATQRCTVLELTAKNCHWPFGEPQSPDFFFCGGDALDGKSYCQTHCDLAYRGLWHPK